MPLTCWQNLWFYNNVTGTEQWRCQKVSVEWVFVCSRGSARYGCNLPVAAYSQSCFLFTCVSLVQSSASVLASSFSLTPGQLVCFRHEFLACSPRQRRVSRVPCVPLRVPSATWFVLYLVFVLLLFIFQYFDLPLPDPCFSFWDFIFLICWRKKK